ncbi:hypothetical protein [Clostridium saccharobutylicum]|uniref:Uncharacterized protein n=1 Tax=Clostridium saccharobutylicum TaxID=169679 RepID=A0A1S8NJW4_CLOSA|nr:hypothetical protein [Clostridium saccharobutylicum]OOM16740.1 hypothetical protein CLOSAC_10340 [Clostridium saccharobutylicum]
MSRKINKQQIHKLLEQKNKENIVKTREAEESLLRALKNYKYNPYTKPNKKIITENEYKNKARIELGIKCYIVKTVGSICVFASLFFLFIVIAIDIAIYIADLSISSLDNIGIVSLKMLSPILFIVYFVCRSYEKFLIDQKVEELKNPVEICKNEEERNETKFEELSNINIEHLNNYYKQTYDQCDKSFSIAKIASNASYIILATGLILFLISTFIFKDDRSRLIMFGITTGTGVVVKIVSSLYFYMYNTSVSKLSEYHDKLYAIQNILISLELSNQIKDSAKKDDVKVDMVKRLLEIGSEVKVKDK